MNDRDRLLLVFAELASYGVSARESLRGSASEAREDLLVALWRRRPNALGS